MTSKEKEERTMTIKQKEVIIKALKDQISTMTDCSCARAIEENWESCSFFNEIIDELNDALTAFEKSAC